MVYKDAFEAVTLGAPLVLLDLTVRDDRHSFAGIVLEGEHVAKGRCQGDEAGASEVVDVVGVRRPGGEGPGETGAVVGAREHEDAHRVHVRVLTLPERRVD